MAEDVRIGTLISDRYRIDALIGEGGMGRVYSAEHVMMKKRLAVKVLRRELTTVPDVVARFEREAMAAANIDHPNVAAATDFGKLADGSVYLVLEFVQGTSLRDEIAEGPLALERSLHIARQIAAGLGSAHAQGIVHRDLKPENVMLVERGADKNFVKVLDFGIAKVPIGEVPQADNKDQPITKAGMVFGTPEYMSPEQALGQTVDGRADLYSLGIMLFEMLSGSRPFSSSNPVGILGQQLANPPPTFAERAPGAQVPPAVEQIVHRLMARDREQRFNRASELVSVLDALLAPAPGRGGYRFTLADGSPSGVVQGDAMPGAPAANRLDAGSGGVAPVVRAHGLDTPSTAVATAPTGLAASLRSAMSSVFPPADALRERLPARLRESLRPVPARTLLIAGGAFALLIAGLVVALAVSVVRGVSRGTAPGPVAATGSSPTKAPSALPSVQVAPPAPTEARASAAEMAAAVEGGAPALEALASKYPFDARPLVEVARVWVASKDFVKATGAVGRALAVDPKTQRDDRVAGVLFQAAQSRASADAAFALLEGPMGERGAEIQWDLAAEIAVKPWVRTRAGQWLRSAEFRRVAPPSLKLAAELRTAASCDAAHALLARAKQEGDERSLSQLEAWQSTSGCGKKRTDDCMPCLRKDSALADAIQAIQARRPAR